MKKIISSKSWLFINLVGILCFGAVSVYSLYISLQYILQKNNLWIPFCIFTICSLFILILFLTALNRLSCIVWHDDVHIGRKGLLFGFRYQIRLQDIKDIVVVSVTKQGQYIIIIDDFGRSVEGFSSKSFLRFEFTEKNKEFIKPVCIEKNIRLN